VNPNPIEGRIGDAGQEEEEQTRSAGANAGAGTSSRALSYREQEEEEGGLLTRQTAAAAGVHGVGAQLTADAAARRLLDTVGI
jgi:hypothetical protein